LAGRTNTRSVVSGASLSRKFGRWKKACGLIIICWRSTKRTRHRRQNKRAPLPNVYGRLQDYTLAAPTGGSIGHRNPKRTKILFQLAGLLRHWQQDNRSKVLTSSRDFTRTTAMYQTLYGLGRLRHGLKPDLQSREDDGRLAYLSPGERIGAGQFTDRSLFTKMHRRLPQAKWDRSNEPGAATGEY